MRIESGRPVAHVAAEMGISRPTAYKWWGRWRAEGEAGLVDRSSRPYSCPHRCPAELESAIEQLRRALKLGPVRIAARLGVPASTVHRVLCRLGLNRLGWMDRPTGRVIRRIHTERPGELVHVDVKKLGRIPDGGGWRAVGREAVGEGRRRRTRGMSYVHSAVDGHTRLAFSHVLDDERGPTCAQFWREAKTFFDAHAIAIDAVLTDNALAYRSSAFAAA